MGVACSTYCQTCNIEGPEIGDQGMIGYPSLEDKKDYDEEWGATSFSFGWIYAGFNALKLNIYELEAYKAFLEEHNGHNIIFRTDHGDDEPDIDWDSLKEFEYPKDDFINAFYELESKETGEKFITTYSGFFRQFEKSILSLKNIKTFAQKIINEQEINDSFYSVSPVIDPCEDLEKIIRFISENIGKTILVRLVPA